LKIIFELVFTSYLKNKLDDLTFSLRVIFKKELTFPYNILFALLKLLKFKLKVWPMIELRH